jgi:hypothetical protein
VYSIEEEEEKEEEVSGANSRNPGTEWQDRITAALYPPGMSEISTNGFRDFTIRNSERSVRPASSVS